jgi:threonine synthase
VKFHSTKNIKDHQLSVDLEEAVLNGLAPDGGLYMMDAISKFDKNFFQKINGMSFSEMAFEVMKYFINSDDVPLDVLHSMTDAAFNFELPLRELDNNIYVLELFHGPTLAFKDFGARFMAQLLSYFVKKTNKKITILVATSGDTGSAVADGFFNVENIDVVILYPSKKVSISQEKMLTSMGGNITALEVEGTFDDCQNMVKQAFLDKGLKQKINFASANSINIARLLPQSLYYVYLCSKLNEKEKKIVVSVPSGNFGNLTAGLIAKRMGAPIYKFIVSTNINDTVPEYLQTGKFNPRPSLSTISNAMDVGNPSNFARMLELYENDVEKMKQDIYGVSFRDEETKDIIKKVFNKYNYIMDPHGAVAYLGLCDYLKNSNDVCGVFLETAHPAKFSDIVEPILETRIPVPKTLEKYLNHDKKSIIIKNKFEDFKKFLLTRDNV